MKRTALIMAGGSGERFWPMSRKKKPKQLLSLFSEKTLIEESIERIPRFIDSDSIFIITGGHLLEPIRKALPFLPPENVIAEPAKRNTAPCLALGAAFLQKKYEGSYGPEEISIAVLTADQLISPVEGFHSTIKQAMEFVENNPSLCTIGIPPSRPETGYGYIETERQFSSSEQVVKVSSFKEKPDIDIARAYVESGRFLWNSGMFFWRLDTFINEMTENMPEVGSKIGNLCEAYSGNTEKVLDSHNPGITYIFEGFPNQSIDYGLMERSKNVYVSKAGFDWDDVGSWDAVSRVKPKDGSGNVMSGNVILDNVKNSVFINDSGRELLLAGLALEDIAVISTNDAVLVCDKNQVQDIKKITSALKKKGMEGWL